MARQALCDVISNALAALLPTRINYDQSLSSRVDRLLSCRRIMIVAAVPRDVQGPAQDRQPPSGTGTRCSPRHASPGLCSRARCRSRRWREGDGTACLLAGVSLSLTLDPAPCTLHPGPATLNPAGVPRDVQGPTQDRHPPSGSGTR